MVVKLLEIHSSVKSQLKDVDRFVKNAFSITPYEFIANLILHISRYNGKKIRASLVLLSGSSFGETTYEHIKLAGIIEIFHTATLVHDDVLDDAQIRRFAQTICSKWGSETAVLLGDYLFSQAAYQSTLIDNNDIVKILSSASIKIAEGEIYQVANRSNFGLTEEEYLSIIQKKTALLFALSAGLGAKLGGANEKEENSLYNYGLNLGIAFQIMDDITDLIGDEKVAGKTLGSDLKKGKITLAVIRLRDLLKKEYDVKRLNLILQEFDDTKKLELKQMLIQHRALEYSISKAKEFIEKAKKELLSLKNSEPKAYLTRLAESIVESNYLTQ